MTNQTTDPIMSAEELLTLLRDHAFERYPADFYDAAEDCIKYIEQRDTASASSARAETLEEAARYFEKTFEENHEMPIWSVSAFLRALKTPKNPVPGEE